MRQLLELYQHILDTGTPIHNARTGKDVLMTPGAMSKYDLRDGYPAATTKKLFFDPMKGELCAFMRGATSAAEFRALGCNIWNQNANETPAWLANPHRKGEDDLGPIYGKQWTAWDAYRVYHTYDERGGVIRDRDLAWHDADNGWQTLAIHGPITVAHKRINQLEEALRKILHDPTNRRIIISGWNPADLDRVALPACHVTYQFIADPERKLLHMTMWQRSNRAPLQSNLH